MTQRTDSSLPPEEAEGGRDEMKREQLTGRSFAGTNMAADQRRQPDEREGGLSDHPTPGNERSERADESLDDR